MSRDLFAITSYYNPACYKRRLYNYHIFRENLNVPLVTVELGNQGQFELKPGDADILVQIPNGDILWQKERLLNIALQHVPDHAEAVAWIDCDVIFGRNDWAEATLEKLTQFPLVQLFHEVYYMDRDVMPTNSNRESTGQRLESVVARMLADSDLGAASDPNYLSRFEMKVEKRLMHGLAWAARRSLLRQHYFYDAFILGGGDRALFHAAMGWIDKIVAQRFSSNPRRKSHYLSWAEPVHRQIQGNIGFLENILYHLWHGEIVDRRYEERHIQLNRIDFDPYQDILINQHGAYIWSSPRKRDMHDYIKSYFHQRNEDGDKQ